MPEIIHTNIPDCKIIKPIIYQDERGYFFESFNQKQYAEKLNLIHPFVQINQSFSNHGVLRGLHAQKGDFQQGKLIQVIEGEILDVAVDIRPYSKTFSQHTAVILSDYNKKQIYIPRGFLHGFIVLSPFAKVFYYCDNFYHKDAEIGVIFNDKNLAIDWKVSDEAILLSEKDENLPSFDSLISSISNNW